MIHLEFTEEEIEERHYWRFHPPHPRVQERCEGVSLKALGVPHQEIGRLAQRSQPTVWHDLEMYQEGRLERLKQLDFYQPTSELEVHQGPVEEAFRTAPPQTINEACERMEPLTGVRRSPTPVRAFLKRMGLKGRKVGQIPAQADPGEQATFPAEKLQPRLEEAQQGQRHVFFVDAAPFVHRAFLGFLWCFSRIFTPALRGRERFNVLGALHATTQQRVTVTNRTSITAETIIALLRQLTALFPDFPLTLVLDNARYQRCHAVMAVAAELGIEWLFLPPSSPNLNLIERLWKFLKKECLYSKYDESFEAFKQAILTYLADTQGQHREKLSRLLTLKFQTFENEKL